MKKQLLLVALLVAACFQARAQYDLYEKHEYVIGGDTLRYRVMYPENYEAGKKYPMVLFLHGLGESGSDNELQLRFGAGQFANPVNRERYPAIVIFPQCPVGKYWLDMRPASFDESGMTEQPFAGPMTLVWDLVQSYADTARVDRDRIYVMGLSMGGMGTYDLVCRFPDFFAAAVPICGAANTRRLEAPARSVAFRIYHGDADPIVPVEASRRAYKALKRYGAQVEYFEFPGVWHDSWSWTFLQPGFLDWVFSQKKQ
ncbi:MAG: prolyl oligopeptidase family serine peptidase [Rikenellaceae bacterium]|nr:prolyl oligopeptidase family serine peptidase [Rikenellaceae bacterium]